MNKQELRHEIFEYLRGPRQKFIICHLSDIFTLISEGRSYVISRDAAATFIKEHSEVDLIHFSLLNRKWNTEVQEFTGPLDQQPEIFNGYKVRTIEIDKLLTAESIISGLTVGKPFSLATKEVKEENGICLAPGVYNVFY
jgi:hypothetical protein